MNLRTLGTALAFLVKDNQEPQRIFTDLVTKVQEIVDAIETNANEVIEGYQNAGGTWSDTVDSADEPGADGTPGYHCHACKMHDAPVEELSFEEKLDYIVDYHPRVPAREWAGKLIEQHYSDLSIFDIFINKWFEEARKAQNPNVWE